MLFLHRQGKKSMSCSEKHIHLRKDSDSFPAAPQYINRLVLLIAVL